MTHNPAVNVVELFRLWNSDLQNGDVAKALGVSRFQLWTLARRHGLSKRTHIQGKQARSTRPEVNPTDEELEARKAEVQALWSDAEREKRRVGPQARPWSLPSFSYDGRSCAFAKTSLD